MKTEWMITESELDDIQLRVCMATLDKPNIVSGCAGSGKSVLAVHKLKRLVGERGASCRMVVYTKALCDYMRSGKEALGIPEEIPIDYHWYWKNRLDCPKTDYIIVDEIQDFTDDEIKEFIQSARKGFFFYGDTAQSLYSKLKNTLSVEEIKRRIPDAKGYELYNNYRLPLPVARMARKVGIDLEIYPDAAYKSKESSIPRVLDFPSQHEQIKAIHRIINQRNLTKVAILLPKNDMVSEVYSHLIDLGGDYEARYKERTAGMNYDNLNFGLDTPKIMTYHSAKGLQFNAVFLPYVEDFSAFNDDARNSLYVAMTRTRRDLYIFHTGTLPEPISDIDTSLYKTEELEEEEHI